MKGFFTSLILFLIAMIDITECDEYSVNCVFFLLFSLLFSLITKEKGTLVMLEKLCSRLKESRTDAVAQKCSYCLTLLTHTEKSLRRLIEHMKDFRGKFQIPDVHGSFTQLIAKAGKVNNNQLKVVIDELSAKVDECLRINEDGEEVEPPAHTQTQTQKGKGAGRGRKKKIRRSLSDESENEENVKPRRGGRRAATQRPMSESD